MTNIEEIKKMYQEWKSKEHERHKETIENNKSQKENFCKFIESIISSNESCVINVKSLGYLEFEYSGFRIKLKLLIPDLISDCHPTQIYVVRNKVPKDAVEQEMLWDCEDGKTLSRPSLNGKIVEHFLYSSRTVNVEKGTNFEKLTKDIVEKTLNEIDFLVNEMSIK